MNRDVTDRRSSIPSFAMSDACSIGRKGEVAAAWSCGRFVIRIDTVWPR
jgi:hypothetical protein